MKLAFIEVAGNKIDAFEACTQLCESHVADVTLTRITAPDVLKIPVCAKRALEEGCEAALVFFTSTAEDSHALDLVHEKIIDVELDSRKFVFFTLIFEDEWRSAQQLQAVTNEKLAQTLEALFNSVHAEMAGAVEETSVPSPEEGTMGMFAEKQPPEEQPGEPQKPGSGRGLF